MSWFSRVRSSRQQPARTNSSVPTPTRQLLLGLDWGTSTTKMVLRDYDAQDAGDLGVAYVVERQGSPRYPSAVSLSDGRLFFGYEAVGRASRATRTWPSLKMDLLRARDIGQATAPMPDLDLSLEDLAVLSLAHLIGQGLSDAKQLAQAKGQRAQLEVMVGMPITRGSDPRRLWYAELARRARRIAIAARTDPHRKKLSDLRELAQRSRSAEPLVQTAEDAHPEYDWNRPELAAALFWPYRNPEVREGLYTAVDLGAGTTNCSFYRLAALSSRAGWVRRGQISFYAGQCAEPGIDALDQALAAHLGRTDWASLRTHENRYLHAPAAQVAVTPVINQYVNRWVEERKSAFMKEQSVARWNDINVLVVGGGSRIRLVADAFRDNPHKSARGHQWVGDLGSPDDLFHMPSSKTEGRRPRLYKGESSTLFVAYGLAVRRGDFAKVHPSDEVSAFRPEGPLVRETTSEELGYGDR